MPCRVALLKQAGLLLPKTKILTWGQPYENEVRGIYLLFLGHA
jgi:hypothetical protein